MNLRFLHSNLESEFLPLELDRLTYIQMFIEKVIPDLSSLGNQVAARSTNQEGYNVSKQIRNGGEYTYTLFRGR